MVGTFQSNRIEITLATKEKNIEGIIAMKIDEEKMVKLIYPAMLRTLQNKKRTYC